MPPDQISLASGHTFTAFAVAVPVTAPFPESAVGVWFCAVSIAISRIILGMHFFSGVAAGATLGRLLGTAARGLLG